MELKHRLLTDLSQNQINTMKIYLKFIPIKKI